MLVQRHPIDGRRLQQSMSRVSSHREVTLSPLRVVLEGYEEVAQARWLALSTNAKQMFTRRSSEYVPFDDPGFVVNAIREVYDQSRRS